MTTKRLVVQHNKIVEARYRLSVGEQRLIKYLVSLIDPRDEDFKPYQIAVADLLKLLGLSDKDFYRKIKVWTERLIGNVLVFRGEDEEELQVAWLSSAKYQPKSGVMELQFSPELKPFLLHLKSRFTAYELANIIRLKHTYSIRLYELLKQYEKLGRREVKIGQLRELLMLEKGEYPRFCDFRRWILKAAQTELAEKTDLVFTWTERKVKQKCVAIEFTIESQPFPKERETLDHVPLPIELPVNEIEPDALPGGAEELIALGVSRTVALTLAEQYGASRVLAMAAYTHALMNTNKLVNPAGFVVEAIKNGYQEFQVGPALTREYIEKHALPGESWDEARQRLGRQREKSA